MQAGTRKRLSKRLTELGASTRTTGRALGVSNVTVQRDTQPDVAVTDVTEPLPSPPPDQDEPEPPVTDVTADEAIREATAVVDLDTGELGAARAVYPAGVNTPHEADREAITAWIREGRRRGGWPATDGLSTRRRSLGVSAAPQLRAGRHHRASSPQSCQQTVSAPGGTGILADVTTFEQARAIVLATVPDAWAAPDLVTYPEGAEDDEMVPHRMVVAPLGRPNDPTHR